MVLQLGLFATPVAYGLEVIPRSWWPWYSALNPLAPVIDGYRRTVLLGEAPRLDLLAIAAASSRRRARRRLPGVQAAGDGLRRCRLTARSPRPTSGSGSAPTRRASRSGRARPTPSATCAGRGRRGWRWALEDVDVQVEPGESIGLVGINGSGKSTLLKILTRVMYPYAGRVEVAGRIGALIEVRAGIHPELTGRENIHLYGTLLGLPRRMVGARFDEIVEFAELEDAVDRQVKFYSSGMQMRLGFAVAAFLEPDVLLVDEVLAVGDAGFQQRCLDRMRTMLSGGTTLVFVSHDLAAVESISERVAVAPRRPGPGRRSRPRRARARTARRSSTCPSSPPTPTASCASSRPGSAASTARCCGPRSRPRSIVVLRSAQPAAGRVCIGCSEGPATPIFLLRHDVHLPDDGEVEVRCRIDHLPLPAGPLLPVGRRVPRPGRAARLAAGGLLRRRRARPRRRPAGHRAPVARPRRRQLGGRDRVRRAAPPARRPRCSSSASRPGIGGSTRSLADRAHPRRRRRRADPRRPAGRPVRGARPPPARRRRRTCRSCRRGAPAARCAGRGRPSRLAAFARAPPAAAHGDPRQRAEGAEPVAPGGAAQPRAARRVGAQLRPAAVGPPLRLVVAAAAAPLSTCAGRRCRRSPATSSSTPG